MQLLLPSELKHLIVELSSKDTLLSLARTHSAIQREAEQALYRTLSNPSFKCLETLATNSEKAGFVHFLMERIYPSTGPLTVQMIDYLFKIKRFYLLNALVNMHCLSDLRLQLPGRYCDDIRPWTKSLNIILWSVH